MPPDVYGREPIYRQAAAPCMALPRLRGSGHSASLVPPNKARAVRLALASMGADIKPGIGRRLFCLLLEK